ncbi:hypothetical protein ACIBI9_57460 [Nonomuraea sp. NPDC050451]|uniref:hypothetical protein n=1 Tax=Nonomuraea sp. NPDC050451 TaxID=3364364 RepID=UPI0037BDB0C7
MRASVGMISAVDGSPTGRENPRPMVDLGRLDRRRAEGVVGRLPERFDLVGAADRRAGGYRAAVGLTDCLWSRRLYRVRAAS